MSNINIIDAILNTYQICFILLKMVKWNNNIWSHSSLTSPVGLPSDHLQESRQSRDALNNQKLFPKATLIKPKSAAEVAAKTFPNVNQFQQQILSPVSTIASESSQSQGKLKCLSPNNPSIILSTQEGMGGKSGY